jgi:myosin VIIa
LVRFTRTREFLLLIFVFVCVYFVLIKGNAKTIRNNNSSRFGKFIQVLIGKKHQIVGATIDSYLLEKSRIAKQSPEERNYHIFYELLEGTSAEEKSLYHLLPATEYFYVSQSGCRSITGVSDKKHFEQLKLAFMVLNFEESDIQSIFKILSAILWIGNVQIVQEAGKDTAAIDHTNKAAFFISSLLEIDESKLSQAFCVKKLKIRNETTLVPLKMAQVSYINIL